MKGFVMKQIILFGDSVRMQYQPVVGEKLADVVAADKERMICEDHIHLTAAGIEAVAAKTAEVLRKLL